MATVPQTQQEGSFWQSLYTSGALPERFRKYGMDNMGAMSYITRDYTKFASMLAQRFPKTKVVNDREHRVHELTELDRTITITVASGAGNNHTTFGVANAQAAMFQPNDIYFVRGLYAYAQAQSMVAGQVLTATNQVPATNVPPPLGYTVGGQPTAVVYGRTWGEDPTNTGFYFIDYDQIIVRSVGAPNSAGAGNTQITVERFYTGPGARDFGGARVPLGLVNAGVNLNNAGAILGGDVLLRATPSWPEGSGTARGFHKNPVIDNNFTQEFKYAVEIVKESKINATYLDKDPLEINRMLRMKQMSLDWERTLLFGRKGKSVDSMGNAVYTMGGIAEYIPRDTDHVLRHTAPTISYPSLQRLLDQVMKNGGSTEKICPIGTTLYTDLKIAFYDSGYMRYDEEASKEFDIPVESIIHAGVKLILVPSQTMEETGYSRKMLCLDLGVPSFTVVTHKEWDMIINKDIGNKGEQIYKEEWIGIKGLERRYAQYQSIISFE
jgi:hypothetical protein